MDQITNAAPQGGLPASEARKARKWIVLLVIVLVVVALLGYWWWIGGSALNGVVIPDVADESAASLADEAEAIEVGDLDADLESLDADLNQL